MALCSICSVVNIPPFPRSGRLNILQSGCALVVPRALVQSQPSYSRVSSAVWLNCTCRVTTHLVDPSAPSTSAANPIPSWQATSGGPRLFSVEQAHRRITGISRHPLGRDHLHTYIKRYVATKIGREIICTARSVSRPFPLSVWGSTTLFASSYMAAPISVSVPLLSCSCSCGVIVA